MDVLTHELQTAKELAVRAGAILLQHYAKDLSVSWKGQGDPVTSADQEASRFLVAELKQRFPEDGILSEEEQDNAGRLSKSRVWIVDPMDGTTEFISRSGEFAVMIGLANEGAPILGVVYQPIGNKLYYAAAGSGAFIEQEGVKRTLRVSAEADASRIIAVVSRSHDSADEERIRRILKIEHVVRSGSAGLKIGMICEGNAHLYFHSGRGTSQWDTCGPEAILHEAGGRLTDIFGGPLRYNVAETRNPAGLIASNGAIHDRVVDAAKSLKESGR